MDRAPPILIFALRAVCSRFMPLEQADVVGRDAAAKALALMIKDFGTAPTLKITVMQCLSMHELQEGRMQTALQHASMYKIRVSKSAGKL